MNTENTDASGPAADAVTEARQTLESALDRLERAFAAHAARAESALRAQTQAPSEGAAAEAHEELKRENAHLRAANENAAGRLDAAIGRLEKLLAE